MPLLFFFRPFSVPPVVTVFTLRKALRLRNIPFFFSLLPRSRLAGSYFRCVGLFSSWLEWSLPPVEVLGESLGRLLRPVGSPRFKSLGYRASWSPWLLFYRAVASVTFRLHAATSAAPVHHALCQPCFPRNYRLRGC